jgi:ornithine cyclodeaminase
VVRIVTLEEIRRAVDPATARREIAEGFISYSRGDVQLPEIGELRFVDPAGEAHIKHGYVTGDEHFVIKVATGFYDNPRRGLPAQDGLMLVHERATGHLAAILLDRGWLTGLRTALAGALVAEQLAPVGVDCIGVIGTGVQARLQVQHLQSIVDCRRLLVWGRRREQAESFASEFAERGYDAQVAQDTEEIAGCRLVITATATTRPVLARVAPGTHVTAVGCDSPHKHEIAPAVFAAADLVVADSIQQCLVRGDLHHAVAAGAVDPDQVLELGTLLREPRQREPDDISIVDLTGLGVQDIRIAQHVLQRLARE